MCACVYVCSVCIYVYIVFGTYFVQMYHFVTAYFQQYMADFEPILSLTDDLSVAIADTLKSTHNKHQSAVRVVCMCSVCVCVCVCSACV